MQETALEPSCIEGVHVIVVGCGRVGSELAVRLTSEGHSVVMIDKEQRAFRRLPQEWRGKQLIGFGFDRDCLEAADIKAAHALAAVTSGDNTNILTARIARENYGLKNVVARIYDPRRAVIYQRLGIPTVATVTWTTDQAIRRLFPDQSNTEWTDPSGEMMLLELSLPSHLIGRRLSSLNETGIRQILMVTRANSTKLVTDVTVGQEGDIIRLVVQRSGLPAVNDLFLSEETL